MRFHQLERGTADRVRNKRVNERTGEEVPYADIVKGYELGNGEYVVLDASELQAVAPERSQAIEVEAFVDVKEIDPLYYRGAYYVVPQGDAAHKAYVLLRRAMEDAAKAAVARFVLRNKEYLVAVRPRQDVLVLETMYFADEIKDPRALPLPEADVELSERELATAALLLESMTRPWDPSEYADTYQERLGELIERKRQGEVVVAEAPAAPSAPVADLMEALQASIERARQERGENEDGASAPSAPRRAPKAPSRRRGGRDGAKKASAQGTRAATKRGRSQAEGRPAPRRRAA